MKEFSNLGNSQNVGLGIRAEAMFGHSWEFPNVAFGILRILREALGILYLTFGNSDNSEKPLGILREALGTLKIV